MSVRLIDIIKNKGDKDDMVNVNRNKILVKHSCNDIDNRITMFLIIVMINAQ